MMKYSGAYDGVSNDESTYGKSIKPSFYCFSIVVRGDVHLMKIHLEIQIPLFNSYLYSILFYFYSYFHSFAFRFFSMNVFKLCVSKRMNRIKKHFISQFFVTRYRSCLSIFHVKNREEKNSRHQANR